MRASDFLPEKINPEVVEPDFYAETNVDLPGVGPLKFVAKNIKPRPYTPQFLVKVFRPDGQSIAYFRFLVMDYEEPTGFRFLSKFKKFKDPYVIGANVSVWNEFQRKGIARAVYQWVKSMGNDLKPSPTQTDAGRAMWRGFEKAPLEEVEVLGSQSLIDVFVKGRHGNDVVTKLIAREFPNSRLDKLIQLLVDKYNVNPNAIIYGPSRQTKNEEQELTEKKKRRKKSRWAFSGPGGWYGYYYGGSSESEAGGDGGGESVAENNSSVPNVIFINDKAAIVGQQHGKTLKLSDSDRQRIRTIADKHGAWYEGNGMDQEFTKDTIDQYQGSWDDDLLSGKIKGYPAPFLYVLFSNVEENDTIEKIGADSNSTIFDRILNTQPSTNYFPDRQFDADTLEKFLQSVSEGPHDFVKMSRAPATEQNMAKFLKLGEQLMWPNNWEEYPNRAGRVAKSVNDLRDKFLASRKRGVYVAGSDHLKAVEQFLGQTLSENFADGKVKGKSRPGRVKRSGASFNVNEAKTTREDFEGMTIEMVKNGHVLVVNALDDWGNNILGSVAFNIGDDNELDPQDLKVDERYQGQGIARAMYDYVKSKGYKIHRSYDQTDAGKGFWDKHRGEEQRVWENFADGKVKGKSRPGRVKKSGASCAGSVTDLRARARKYGGERGRMYHWCANMKSGRKNESTDVLNELSLGNYKVGEIVFKITRHLLERLQDRNVPFSTVNELLRRISLIKDQMQQLQVGQKLWAYDSSLGISLGLTLLDSGRINVGTAILGFPRNKDSSVPVVDISQD